MASVDITSGFLNLLSHHAERTVYEFSIGIAFLVYRVECKWSGFAPGMRMEG